MFRDQVKVFTQMQDHKGSIIAKQYTDLSGD